jgi:hypothetical protein
MHPADAALAARPSLVNINFGASNLPLDRLPTYPSPEPSSDDMRERRAPVDRPLYSRPPPTSSGGGRRGTTPVTAGSSGGGAGGGTERQRAEPGLMPTREEGAFAMGCVLAPLPLPCSEVVGFARSGLTREPLHP